MNRQNLDELEVNLQSLTNKGFFKRDIIAMIKVRRRKIEEN